MIQFLIKVTKTNLMTQCFIENCPRRGNRRNLDFKVGGERGMMVKDLVGWGMHECVCWVGVCMNVCVGLGYA